MKGKYYYHLTYKPGTSKIVDIQSSFLLFNKSDTNLGNKLQKYEYSKGNERYLLSDAKLNLECVVTCECRKDEHEDDEGDEENDSAWWEWRKNKNWKKWKDKWDEHWDREKNREREEFDDLDFDDPVAEKNKNLLKSNSNNNPSQHQNLRRNGLGVLVRVVIVVSVFVTLGVLTGILNVRCGYHCTHEQPERFDGGQMKSYECKMPH